MTDSYNLISFLSSIFLRKVNVRVNGRQKLLNLESQVTPKWRSSLLKAVTNDSQKIHMYVHFGEYQAIELLSIL